MVNWLSAGGGQWLVLISFQERYVCDDDVVL